MADMMFQSGVGGVLDVKELRVNGVPVQGGGGAASGSLLRYDFAPEVVEPPTSNQVRFNAAYPYTAVTKVWVMLQTTDGLDAYLPLTLIASGTKIYVQDRNDHALNVVFTTSGAPVDKATYIELPVTHTSNGGALLANQAVVLARA